MSTSLFTNTPMRCYEVVKMNQNAITYPALFPQSIPNLRDIIFYPIGFGHPSAGTQKGHKQNGSKSERLLKYVVFCCNHSTQYISLPTYRIHTATRSWQAGRGREGGGEGEATSDNPHLAAPGSTWQHLADGKKNKLDSLH